MSLRQRIREETKDLHDQLEQQYPFNALFDSKNLKQDVENALSCFSCMFKDFLLENQKSDPFFLDSLSQLEKVSGATTLKNFSFKDDENLNLSMRYLFIGSRMGNRLLVQKNPKVVEFKGGEYFSLDCPQELWKELISDLDNIVDPKQQDQIINVTRFLFVQLMNFGALTKSVV